MRHVIVGAGPAGVIAAETLRANDETADIVLVGDEPEPPYSRMAIPYLLVGQVEEPGTYLRRKDSHFEDSAIRIHRGSIERIDVAAGSAIGAGGVALDFDRLLIATGSRPVRPPIPGMELPGIENCWTLADARRIAAAATPGRDVVLLGAGFIGCIVLEALAERGVSLSVVERESRMVPRMMDEEGGMLLKDWCEAKGVRVLTNVAVTAIEKAGDRLALSLSTGERIETDLVVSATGVKPNLDLLEGSGIGTDTGILVDARLQSSAAGIFAAGDVAQGPVFNTERREVHAIQPTAADHGRIAALNMLGIDTRYRGSLAMNVLNTLGLVSCSYGEWMGVDGGDSATALDRETFRYLRLEFRDDVLVGAIGLGVGEHVGVLRGLIQSSVHLGEWKTRLLADPNQIAAAYLECVRRESVVSASS
jgi:NADPH-dependent 2,4-dienoyl-CoA reductase/sulfur reductase-like enzyme